MIYPPQISPRATHDIAVVPAGAPDVRKVLAERRLEIHFQPILSMRRGAVIGVEGLARAHTADHRPVAADALFRCASEQRCFAELDERCQSLALETFLPLHRERPDLVLFVNIDAASLPSRRARDSVSFLAERTRGSGIDPRNIAVELRESRFPDPALLRETIAEYRALGFLVVMDDLGSGESNLDRIALLRPDIIKADRTLVQGIEQDFYRQEIFKALIQMSERTGGWVIAEGVETEADAVTTLELGGDLLQGFLLGRPERLPDAPQERAAMLRREDDLMRRTGQKFRSRTLDRVHRERAQRAERRGAAAGVREALESASAATAEEWEGALHAAIAPYAMIESASLLDSGGIQITDTVLAPRREVRSKTVIFAPPGRGANHTLKEYFYVVMEPDFRDGFETQPYVPLPSTDLCITVSSRFRAHDGIERVLCLHMDIARGSAQTDGASWDSGETIASDSPAMRRQPIG